MYALVQPYWTQGLPRSTRGDGRLALCGRTGGLRRQGSEREASGAGSGTVTKQLERSCCTMHVYTCMLLCIPPDVYMVYTYIDRYMSVWGDRAKKRLSSLDWLRWPLHQSLQQPGGASDPQDNDVKKDPHFATADSAGPRQKKD